MQRVIEVNGHVMEKLVVELVIDGSLKVMEESGEAWIEGLVYLTRYPASAKEKQVVIRKKIKQVWVVNYIVFDFQLEGY